MKNELANLGIETVVLSKDTVEDAAHHKARDDLSMQVLADPTLETIRKYGVEHHKAIEVSTGRMNLFGVHLALVPSIKTMAIPTTLLIDEEGIVRWIDQTDDYRLRSQNERILQAASAAFAA